MRAKSVNREQLLREVSNFKAARLRFVTISCVDLGEDGLDVIYHFAKGLRLSHLRLTVPKGKTAPSITDSYFCAFLVENEIRDQFGLVFDGLNIDYGGTLLLEKDVRLSPLCRYNVAKESEKEK